jgi:DNA-binding transcriptional MerR regulator
MATQLSRKHVAEAPVIPDRLYFKIGDVARICEVETYVLRFWETQFPQLKPNKSGTGQRLYRRRDVELALEIKRLVHTEGYTLSGARHALEQGHRKLGQQPSAAPMDRESGSQKDAAAVVLGRARSELREIAGMLASPVPYVPRRRSRVATIPSSDSLFPA